MRIRILVTVLATLLGASAAHAGLINGDFETGDLSGWTTFVTANGTLGVGDAVLDFDTDGNGDASGAARFRVGQATYPYVDLQGGGIRQTVTLGAGAATISAAIATWAPIWGNSHGGLFSLLFDGVTLASHDFGSISIGTTERATLAASFDVTAGQHEVSVLITRPWLQGDNTPLQFVDDVSLRGAAVDPVTLGEPPAQVPEPGSLSLLGLGLLGLARARRLGSRAN